MITREQLVQREVGHCVSYLVSTLTNGNYVQFANPNSAYEKDLSSLFEQAYELASPVDDYEEAARQAGWEWNANAGAFNHDDSNPWLIESGDWRELCEAIDLEPYQWEVYEHWIVSEWLADRLIAHGERVDKDFAGLCVWARTTTGQGIAMDAVMEKIHAELTTGSATNGNP